MAPPQQQPKTATPADSSSDRLSRLRQRLIETAAIAVLIAASFYLGPGADLFH